MTPFTPAPALRKEIGISVEAARLLDCAASAVGHSWTQNANARNALGEPVQPHDTHAVCWCAHGAIHRAAYTIGVIVIDDYGTIRFGGSVSGIVLDRARLAFRLAAEGRHNASMMAVSGLSIAGWNDKDTRTAADVERAFRDGAAIIRRYVERIARIADEREAEEAS